MERQFGRLVIKDERDARFPLRALLPVAPSARTSRYWYANGWWGDQRATSQCVAFAWTHWLEDGPITHQKQPPPMVRPDVLYGEAQRLDEWPGQDYDGTSVRGGIKALRARGLVSAFHWAATILDVVQAVLELGPVVVGSEWYEDMMRPDRKGLIQVGGSPVGGHAYVVNGYSVKSRLFRIKNSWGRDWGKRGHAYIASPELAYLLHNDGEACLASEVKDA